MINVIEFFGNGQVVCRRDNGDSIICKPFDMFKTNDQCGDCPIFEMCEAYEKEKWGTCDEGWVSMPELKARMGNKGKEADKPRDDAK